MAKPEKFRYVIDAKRFNVNSPHIDIPCAYVRACSVNGGKISKEKVLIFLDDEVAKKFNEWSKGIYWTKAYCTQSKHTDRWYMVIDLSEDVSPEHHDFLMSAAEKAHLSGREVPIKSLYFTLRHENGAKLYLSGVFGFNNANTKEKTNVRKNEKTVNDVWKGFTEDQKKFVYFMLSEALNESRKDVTIKRIIFNGPATVVFWTDGTKTVVRYQDGTEVTDDREKAVFAACAKKLMGTNTTGSNYLDRIKPAFDEAQADWDKRVAKKIKESDFILEEGK